MRLHSVALPHTSITRDYDWCAYTGKIRRLAPMLAAYGHETIVYGDSTADVTIVTDQDRERWFGGPWNTSKVFDRWEPADPCWTEMADHAITAIRERIQPGDAIGIIAGRCQAPIVDAFPNHPALEWGIGYVGVLPNTYRCFESRAHQSYVQGWLHDDQGRMFDTVIPNAFDPVDFAYSAEKDDYLLYIGRMTERKGLSVVAELAKDHRVITAGQGELRVDGAEHRGLVLGAERAELFAHARAVLVPTLYLEPFGGVAVEAMLSGTPVITTDFGAFPETVVQGVTGFRCSMLTEFRQAVHDVKALDPVECRAHALDHFSLDAIAPQYDRWLRQIATLQHEGWYADAVR